MNFKMIFRSIGNVSLALAGLLVLPMITSAIYQESSWWSFAVTIGIAVAVGLLLVLTLKPQTRTIFARDGFVIVSLAWIYVSLVGALPFVMSGAIPNYVDALFETVSGFTTTGASILTGAQIESMSKGLLFWRSFTHWVGGMGIIVFVMIFSSNSKDRSMHVLRAEMPGPSVDKVVPKASSMVRILYLIYIGMTFVLIIMLLCGGMPIFDSIVHAFGTAGTGGFGIKADSLASYSPYCQWVVAIFMFLFGINFNIYCLIVLKKLKNAFSSNEFWVYLGIVLLVISAVTVNMFNSFDYTKNFGDALRHSAFQVISFMTTTGYSTIPATSSVNLLPSFTKWILFMLMFIGGCAGSTAGGLTVSRVAILTCAVRKELRKVLNPRNANVVKFEGKALTDETVQSVANYFVLYIFIYVAIFLILCLDLNPMLDFASNATAAASCFNNIGPAYGEVANGYFMYSPLSKIVLIFAMLLGRLEIYPIILLFSYTTWKNSSIKK